MILYKYYPCNRNTFLALSVNGLWCSKYSKMNDPFECLATLERTFKKEEIEKFKTKLIDSGNQNYNEFLLYDDETMTKVINAFRKKPLELYSFCSFSEDPNNILMWTHYANNHSGIVVGFEFPELENNNNLQKVNYRNKLQNIEIANYADFILGNADEYLDEILTDFSIKSEHWSYEKEWRIWRDKEGYYRYNLGNIKEIHFGLNTSIETKAIILRLLHFLPEQFDIKQKEMTFDPLGLK